MGWEESLVGTLQQLVVFRRMYERRILPCVLCVLLVEIFEDGVENIRR